MMEMDRREFLRGAAVAPAAAQEWWSQQGREAKRRLLLVGTQTVTGTSKGIYAWHWDPQNGELRLAGLATESDNPTFLALAPGAKYLYAANELSDFEAQKSGAVSAFGVDVASAKLMPINQVSALGAGTCNVTVDHTGQCAFCANYNGGSASSFYLSPNGQISDAVSHFQYHGHGPNPQRQETPHAHRVTVSPDNRYLLVNDLGLDCIHIYHLDPASAKLTPGNPAKWNAAPGSGPRALRFHPNRRIAYCVCEMASTVDVLDWDARHGTFRQVQSISLIPADYHGPTRGCDIVLDHAGDFAYAANRDYNCLVSFAVGRKDGELTMLARSSCGGKIPRHLALDPTEKWLLVANEESDTIAVFARNEQTGRLAESGKTFPQSKPQCLVFA
ncbi:MAG TPA: lactonase family protein [Acidobacteriaceae bacterium]|nr:lactonase family protein [Acidobacteriaceae bacterium]